MNKFAKITASIMLAIAMVGIVAANAYAEGSVSVTADKETCESGDHISVTIEAVPDDGQASPPQLSVEYNPNRLSFDNCSVEYGGGGGGLITINDTSAVIDFTTLSGGDATVSVTAVLDDDSTNVQIADATVSVAGEDVAAGTDTDNASSTGVEEGTISAGNGRMVQMVFANEFMPVLFHKATIDYQGQTVECAQFDMADMTLLYTTDEASGDGKFCVYNIASGELSDFRMIQGIENRFIIILNEDAAEVPYGYTKAVLDWNGQTLTAYMNMDAASGDISTFGGVAPADFFLIYGLSSEGNKGWYQYDQTEGTYQRFLQISSNTGMEMTDESGTSKVDAAQGSFLDGFMSRKLQTIILLVAVALVLILIIVVVILAIKCAEYNDYEYVDADEYYGNNETSEPVKNVKRVTAAEVVAEEMADDEEEDDDEADAEEAAEDDEDDDETSDLFDPRASRREMKEQKRLQKEAAREEKWRQKEEKKAAKMRDRGYEEAQPMDWSTFENSQDEKDNRRPDGTGELPAYMKQDIEEKQENDASGEAYGEANLEQQKLPARKPNPSYTQEKEAESVRARKEEEMRMKQKRLFEQQQRIEEQRRIEQEQYEQQQQLEQAKFVLSQQDNEEDLDEDFQFEFLNL